MLGLSAHVRFPSGFVGMARCSALSDSFGFGPVVQPNPRQTSSEVVYHPVLELEVLYRPTLELFPDPRVT